MAESVKVKFTRAYAVKAKGGEKYKEGQTVELSRASAEHFINRGAAEEVETEQKAAPAAEEKPDFDAMTKAELEQYAYKHKVEGVTQSMNKDDMVKALKKAAK